VNKKIIAIIGACFILLMILVIIFATIKINGLNNQISKLQNQLDIQEKAQEKAFLVTSLGISVEPRNVTYPHPHFTIEGIVINVGTKTAYNASLQIIAYYKSGTLALNMTIPFGNLAKWETGHVNEIIATSDWIGNYTVTPTWLDAS
jgi:hypothetical protein